MEFGRRDWPNALDSIISARLSHVYQIRAPRPAKDNIDGGGHRFFLNDQKPVDFHSVVFN